MEHNVPVENLGVLVGDKKIEQKPSLFRKITNEIIATQKKDRLRRKLDQLEKTVSEKPPHSDEEKKKYTYLSKLLRQDMEDKLLREKMSLEEKKVTQKRLNELDFPTQEQENLFRSFEYSVKHPQFTDPQIRKEIIERIQSNLLFLTPVQQSRINIIIEGGSDYHIEQQEKRVELEKEESLQKIQNVLNSIPKDSFFQEAVKGLTPDKLSDFERINNQLSAIEMNGNVMPKFDHSYNSGAFDEQHTHKTLGARYQRFTDEINNANFPAPLESLLLNKLEGITT